MDASEAGEGESAEDGGNGLVSRKKRGGGAGNSHDQPNPPALLSPMILHLDDRRMTDPDAQKNGRADDDSADIHLPFNNCAAKVMIPFFFR